MSFDLAPSLAQGPRSQGREAAFQILFGLDQRLKTSSSTEEPGPLEGPEQPEGSTALKGPAPLEESAPLFSELELAQIAKNHFKSFTLPRKSQEFATALLMGVGRRPLEVDARITAASQSWKLNRMSQVDRTILRLCVYELLFEKETSPSVVINEAVELAKRFGSEKSAAFVNGILDRIAKEIVH